MHDRVGASWEGECVTDLRANRSEYRCISKNVDRYVSEIATILKVGVIVRQIFAKTSFVSSQIHNYFNPDEYNGAQYIVTDQCGPTSASR